MQALHFSGVAREQTESIASKRAEGPVEGIPSHVWHKGKAPRRERTHSDVVKPLFVGTDLSITRYRFRTSMRPIVA